MDTNMYIISVIKPSFKYSLVTLTWALYKLSLGWMKDWGFSIQNLPFETGGPMSNSLGPRICRSGSSHWGRAAYHNPPLAYTHGWKESFYIWQGPLDKALTSVQIHREHKTRKSQDRQCQTIGQGRFHSAWQDSFLQHPHWALNPARAPPTVQVTLTSSTPIAALPSGHWPLATYTMSLGPQNRSQRAPLMTRTPRCSPCLFVAQTGSHQQPGWLEYINTL